MMSTVSWNAPLLIQTVSGKHSSERAEALESSVSSISKRQSICNYHRQTYEEAYNSHLPSKLPREDAIAAFFDNSDNSEDRWMQMFIACTANAIGYMQSAHSVIDMMAHAIYHALGLEDSYNTRIKPAQIGMQSVRKAITNQQCADLDSAIEVWTSRSKHAYLSDFTNQIKHRSLVDTKHTVDLNEYPERIHGIVFEAFEKDGRHHPATYIDDFFESFHEEFFNGAFMVGEEINRIII